MANKPAVWSGDLMDLIDSIIPLMEKSTTSNPYRYMPQTEKRKLFNALKTVKKQIQDANAGYDGYDA